LNEAVCFSVLIEYDSTSCDADDGRRDWNDILSGRPRDCNFTMFKHHWLVQH